MNNEGKRCDFLTCSKGQKVYATMSDYDAFGKKLKHKVRIAGYCIRHGRAVRRQLEYMLQSQRTDTYYYMDMTKIVRL